jgi:plastocyanin
MRDVRNLAGVVIASAALLVACGTSTPPVAPAPAPPGGVSTANVYILPGAVALGDHAFGDEPVVIFTGEQMRFRNVDGTEHNVVADTASIPEFSTTGPLAPGAERTFSMRTPGTTPIHCTIHPQMTGTLIVRER